MKPIDPPFFSVGFLTKSDIGVKTSSISSVHAHFHLTAVAIRALTGLFRRWKLSALRNA